MYPITYSIKDYPGNSKFFYQDIKKVTDIVLSKANLCLKGEVENYIKYIQDAGIENCRSYNEYMLEAIMLGVLWRNYEGNVVKTNVWVTNVLYKLYEMRNSNAKLKPIVDRTRGLMISSLLYHTHDSIVLGYSYKSFQRLLNWLDATGEFSEEVKRMNGWLVYTSKLDHQAIYRLIQTTYGFAKLFEEICNEVLGVYTTNVRIFLADAKSEYKHREDFAMATRKEVEYHLNMVGAEILNRELKNKFDQTKQKVVLLPTCMGLNNGTCRSQVKGLERRCIGCNAECNIGKVNQKLKAYNVDTYLIPHSSDFTRFLRRWKDYPDVALVGVACVLNLLKGGYEMIDLGIASQCVYLDFCGCKKHWSKDGFSTSLNMNQLFNVLGCSKD